MWCNNNEYCVCTIGQTRISFSGNQTEEVPECPNWHTKYSLSFNNNIALFDYWWGVEVENKNLVATILCGRRRRRRSSPLRRQAATTQNVW
jgi:hypothetical protein